MQLVWRKGLYSWLAALPEYSEEPDDRFKQVDQPDHASVAELCTHLIKLGGTTVCILVAEEQGCLFFLQNGQPISVKRLRLLEGQPHECHSNSANLWQSNKDQYRLATGYALSEDGIWRRHSWVLDVNDTLIETTEVRVMYYGVVLNGSQASSFCSVYG